MHDPCIVAFEIRRPWRKKPTIHWPKGYRPTMVTIWHVDPERDGSDDSCGWTCPRLTIDQLLRLKSFAWSEGHYPYFLRRAGRTWIGSRREAESMLCGLLLNIAERLDIRMEYSEAARTAAMVMHSPGCSDPAAQFVFEPGYHTNFQTDSPKDREERFCRIVYNLAAWYVLRPRRRWWQHPRWHFWHWRIQVHGVQNLKRWQAGVTYWAEAEMFDWKKERDVWLQAANREREP